MKKNYVLVRNEAMNKFGSSKTYVDDEYTSIRLDKSENKKHKPSKKEKEEEYWSDFCDALVDIMKSSDDETQQEIMRDIVEGTNHTK